MNDVTFTFDSQCGNFTFTIKKDFLEKCADPANESMHKLMTQHHIGTFLHNPYGPAIVNRKNGYSEYWVEGKKATAEVAEKIKHSANFNTKLDQLLE